MKTKYLLLLLFSLALNVVLILSREPHSGPRAETESDQTIRESRKEELARRLEEAGLRLKRLNADLQKGKETLQAIQEKLAATKQTTANSGEGI